MIKKNTTDMSPFGAGDFIDQKELMKRIPVSRRTLQTWRMEGRIPSVKAGTRRVLYHWPSVYTVLVRKQMFIQT